MPERGTFACFRYDEGEPRDLTCSSIEMLRKLVFLGVVAFLKFLKCVSSIGPNDWSAFWNSH